MHSLMLMRNLLSTERNWPSTSPSAGVTSTVTVAGLQGLFGGLSFAVLGLSGPVAQRLKDAWIALQVPQCGYCQPGLLVAATALLSARPDPTPGEIAAALTNLCRCGTHDRVRAAIHRAARAEEPGPAPEPPPAAGPSPNGQP